MQRLVVALIVVLAVMAAGAVLLTMLRAMFLDPGDPEPGRGPRAGYGRLAKGAYALLLALIGYVAFVGAE